MKALRHLALRHLALLAALAVITACKPAAPSAQAPEPAALAALQRGINLGFWTGEKNLDAIHAAQVNPDDADLARIAAIGFRHVRITLDPAWLADATMQPDPARLTEMRQGLERVRAAGLFIVLSLQPTSAVKQVMGGDDRLVQRTARLWQRVAETLQGFTPQQLAYEPLNEPEIEDAARTRVILTALAGGIRKAAPRHLLVLQGPRFSDVEDLIRLTPLDDRNAVYSFHFYEPKNFTHQGVPYGWPMWGLLADLPYPSSPEAVEPALHFMPFEAQEHARFYGQQRWDAAKLAEAIDPAVEWATRHRVKLWCSEFGVYRYKARPVHRAAWLGDTRKLLEARGIGWTLWDYSGYFGLVSGPQGQRVLDASAAEALGLVAPSGATRLTSLQESESAPRRARRCRARAHAPGPWRWASRADGRRNDPPPTLPPRLRASLNQPARGWSRWAGRTA
jgi:hypothetical protein